MKMTEHFYQHPNGQHLQNPPIYILLFFLIFLEKTFIQFLGRRGWPPGLGGTRGEF
jgi:hypothetical protein